ncbi:MAG TPA: FtsQ-type POTRA domain-containing protein [Acidimicrobiales bacterium]|nr:FtsQ-type POTRA domain-containing protein [Acidimicrobiales bacterium]
MKVAGGTRPAMDPRMRHRRAAIARRRGRRRLWVILAVLVVLLGGSGAFLMLHSGLFSARHVTVTGAQHTSAATVEEVAGVARHPPLVDVDPGLASSRLERLPWISVAVVDRVWPDSVRIHVTERVPVATLPSSSGSVALVDGTGRVLADVPSAPGGTVPLSVGEPARSPGSVLGLVARNALSVIVDLPAQLRAQVRGVAAGGPSGVVLDLAGGEQAVLGPRDQLPAKFEALESLIAANALAGPEVVDLTVPNEPTVSPQPAGARS